jgi:exonuclease III
MHGIDHPVRKLSFFMIITRVIEKLDTEKVEVICIGDFNCMWLV